MNINGSDRVYYVSTDMTQGFVLSSTSQNEWQGIWTALTADSSLGLIYLRDGLFPVKGFNTGINVPDSNGQMFNGLGEANAYLLPLADPYGQPDINEQNDTGLYLWKDENKIWHLKQVAGTDSMQISGHITSSQQLTGIQVIDLESADVVDISDLSKIIFDFSSVAGELDEIIFRFPEEASLSIALDNMPDTSLLFIGSQRWPVNNSPVDISGW